MKIFLGNNDITITYLFYFIFYSISMYTEFEIKFLHINPDAIREGLNSVGATCTIPLRRMLRYVFAHPTNNNSYIRIRSEGNKITTS